MSRTRFFRKLWISLLVLGSEAQAIEIDGTGNLTDVRALYIFRNYNAATGLVPDSSGNGLSLKVDNPANVRLTTDRDGHVGLNIGPTAVLRSVDGSGNPVAATSLINACRGSNALTVDIWVRNLSEEPVDRPQPVRIVTLAKRTGTSHSHNFYLGQEYENAGFYRFGLNNNSQNYMTEDAKGRFLFGNTMAAQRVIFTKDANGVARLWRTNAAGILEMAAERTGAPSLSGWDTSMILAIANEPNYSDFPEYRPGTSELNPEWKSWLGTVYALAIYCWAFERKDLLGDAAPGATAMPSYPIDPNTPISTERRRAHDLYKRITGINTPIDNPAVVEMENLVKAGNEVGAALRATQEPEFYNITVRDMAARMSTRDNTVNTPLNDMVATIIGVVRDNVSAQELLTGNFTYRGDRMLAAVPDAEVDDFLLSNRHYQSLEDGRFNLAKVLKRVNGQKLLNGAANAVVDHPDAAGVLTSRAFMSAHAIAGTNRRLVEYTFKEFLCIPIAQWADVTGTDTYVGRDVDRAPGNDHNKYKTTCRSCHSVMDSFRGAFAKVDFSADYVKHADVMFGLNSPNENDNATNRAAMFQSPVGIAGKMARNSDQFSGGYAITDSYWENNAGRGLNATYFGWPAVPQGQATHKGYGMKSFATLVSQSDAFPRCMAIRAYRSLCKRDVTNMEQAMITRVAGEFKQQNYNFRELFARIAVTPQCLKP